MTLIEVTQALYPAAAPAATAAAADIRYHAVFLLSTTLLFSPTLIDQHGY